MSQEWVGLAEAADQLGVHYMTAYRHVRTGRLPAEKRGGVWQVEADLIKRIKERPPEARPRREVFPKMVEERLLVGDEAGVMGIVDEALAYGATADETYLHLLAPAFVSIDERHDAADISTAARHLGMTTLLRVIARTGPKFLPRGRSRGTIILAAPPTDQNSVPTAIVRDLLRSRRFDVEDLGAHTPTQAIVARADEIEDLVAVGIFATAPFDDDEFVADLRTLSVIAEVPTIISGPGIRDESHARSLLSWLQNDSIQYSETVHEAIETFEERRSEQAAAS